MGFLCHFLLNLFTISPNCYDLWVIHTLFSAWLRFKEGKKNSFVLRFKLFLPILVTQLYLFKLHSFFYNSFVCIFVCLGSLPLVMIYVYIRTGLFHFTKKKQRLCY